MTSRAPSEVVRQAVAEGLIPGAGFSYGTATIKITSSEGTFRGPGSPAAAPDTVYDLASLTKVVATTPVVSALCEKGRLSLRTEVSDVLPEFPHKTVTIANLMLHDSGLPAYLDLTGGRAQTEDVWSQICQLPLQTEPGRQTQYSCLGFIALQRVVERLEGVGLDKLVSRYVTGPLELPGLKFRKGYRIDESVPPTTEIEPWRSSFLAGGTGLLQGVVHDPLAFLQGGVSGNAGLFGTADDIGTFAQAVLSGTGPFRASDWLAWTTRQGQLGDRALGWDVPSPGTTSAGSAMSEQAFGHTGFTGTSLWIDPNNGFFACLLSNAVLFQPDRERLRALRSVFADSAFEAI